MDFSAHDGCSRRKRLRSSPFPLTSVTSSFLRALPRDCNGSQTFSPLPVPFLPFLCLFSFCLAFPFLALAFQVSPVSSFPFVSLSFLDIVCFLLCPARPPSAYPILFPSGSVFCVALVILREVLTPMTRLSAHVRHTLPLPTN